MSNLIPKMNQTSIEINGNLNFLKFGMVKVFETWHTFLNEKMNIFEMKIFNEISKSP